jgi:hypothetical protein
MRIRHSSRAIALLIALSLPTPHPTFLLFGRQAAHVVISEIYGGGGNSGSTYTHDFIELYNPTDTDIVMSNWSVQYQSGGGTGAFAAIGKFSGTIRARRFFLIQANPGSAGTAPLPAPDAVAGITLAASSGKVALSSDTESIAGPGSPGVVDFVGYGTANLFEGTAPAVAPGNAVSVERKADAGSDAASMGPGGSDEHSGNGRDSDDNGNDFIRRDPEPQNDASDAESTGGTLSVTTVYGGRWNLVSLPLEVADPSVAAIFPGAETPLYSYNSGYVGETTAVRGPGYWVRFADPETVSFSGAGGGPDTIDLVPGWNLVGAGSGPVAAADVIELPAGLIPSAFYGYDAGYHLADTLWPGHAYWVRSASGGKLVMSPGAPASGKALPGSFDPELPPPPPGITAAEGADGGALLRPDLAGAWPNPFNPVTRIGFSLPEAGPVRIEVVDLSGRVVAVLADGPMTAGSHSVVWDARRGPGVAVSTGTYLVRLGTGGGVVTRKIVYIR